MKFLTDQFDLLDVGLRRRNVALFRLRADLLARSAWYCGRTSRSLSLRMLAVDGALCTVLYRSASALRRWRLSPLAAIVYKLNALLTGAVIGRGAEFGCGLVILHSVGLVVNTSVKCGENVVLEGCVTIGAEKGAAPKLGNHVFVGSGARIIGPVCVGDRARIGANAVVLKDVPEGATVVGIPARIVKFQEGAA